MNKLVAKSVLACPVCHGNLSFTGTSASCDSCKSKVCKIIDSDIYSFLHEVTDTMSKDSWDNLYKQKSSLNKLFSEYQKFVSGIYSWLWPLVSADFHPRKPFVYLEIGCGHFFLGQAISKDTELIIGVDISLIVLKTTKKILDKNGIKNYMLIHGDIQKMPLKENSVDLVYGGGVIEHFREPQICVDEIYRVLKKGGHSVNSVPFLNLGTLVYRSIWGNIPNVPLVRQFAEFIHLKLLGGKHMIFGYELSFLRSTLINMHSRVGFRKIKVSNFPVPLQFDFFPEVFRSLARRLGRESSWFWPMVRVTATK